jgi:HK97 gp10 family phage protein
MGVTVKIEGLRELGAALQAMGDEMGSKIARSATAAAASVIRKRARELAPIADEPYEIEGLTVQPGNIPKNIVSKRLGPGKTRLTSEHIVTVRGKRKYGYASKVGSLQEFGTVKMAPQPFLGPAFEQEKGFAVRAMIDRIKKGIAKKGQR